MVASSPPRPAAASSSLADRRAAYWSHGDAGDEQPDDRPDGRARSSSRPPWRTPPPAARRSPSWRVTPASARPGSSASCCARAESRGAACCRGDAVELGEGELPYAALVGALRPLARDGDPALDALDPRDRAELARLLPGLAGAAPASHATTTRRGQARALRGGPRPARPPRRASAGRARPRGPALGRPLHARVRRLPRPQRCAASACSSSAPTASTSCTAATRCARCWPSSSATPTRRRVTLAAADAARSSPSALEDILGAPPDAGLRRPPLRAQRGQPALHGGAARRRPRRPRRAARDAARRADGPHRAAHRDRPGAAARARRRPARSTTRRSRRSAA